MNRTTFFLIILCDTLLLVLSVVDGPSEKGLKLPPNDCNWPAIHPKPEPFTKTLHKQKHRFFHCQRLSLLGSCQRYFFSSRPFKQRDKLVTIYIYKNKLQLQTNNVLVTKALFPNTEKVHMVWEGGAKVKCWYFDGNYSDCDWHELVPVVKNLKNAFPLVSRSQWV